MPYEFYKVLHLFAVLLLFTAFGGVAMLSLRGEPKAPQRKILMVVHGVAILIIVVAGFGLMARKGMMGLSWPGWIYGKIAVWLLLGAAPVLLRRQPSISRISYIALPLFGGVAALLAVYQPGSVGP
jgi:uncharacterized membrane protein SirB2